MLQETFFSLVHGEESQYRKYITPIAIG